MTPAGLLSLSMQQMLVGSVVTEKPEEVLKKGWRPPTHPQVGVAWALAKGCCKMKPFARCPALPMPYPLCPDARRRLH